MKSLLLFCFCVSCFVIHSQEESHLQGQAIVTDENAVSLAANAVQSAALEVEVFPNPSQGDLTIQGKSGSTVTVYSASGIYVGTWVIGQEEKVSLEDLTTGSYVCAVELEGTRCIKRFVVL